MQNKNIMIFCARTLGTVHRKNMTHLEAVRFVECSFTQKWSIQLIFANNFSFRPEVTFTGKDIFGQPTITFHIGTRKFDNYLSTIVLTFPEDGHCGVYMCDGANRRIMDSSFDPSWTDVRVYDDNIGVSFVKL